MQKYFSTCNTSFVHITVHIPKLFFCKSELLFCTLRINIKNVYLDPQLVNRRWLFSTQCCVLKLFQILDYQLLPKAESYALATLNAYEDRLQSLCAA